MNMKQAIFSLVFLLAATWAHAHTWMNVSAGRRRIIR